MKRTAFGTACDAGFDDTGAAVFEDFEGNVGTALQNAFRTRDSGQKANIRFRWLRLRRDATRTMSERT